MFNRDQNFGGNSFTRNYSIINSTVVNDFQDSKVLTSIVRRHNHRKFSGVSRNNHMQAWTRRRPRTFQGSGSSKEWNYKKCILSKSC